MSFIFGLVFGGGLALISYFFGILAASVLEIFDDFSGNFMPSLIGICWLIVPITRIMERTGNETITVTIGLVGLMGYAAGFYYAISRRNST